MVSKFNPIPFILPLLVVGCDPMSPLPPRVVPAAEFSRAVHEGKAADFSVFNATPESERAAHGRGAESARARLADEGFQARGGIDVPSPQFVVNEKNLPLPQVSSGPPPGSGSPYVNGPMTSNPSLWPDQGEGVFALRDQRAFQPMDIVTILISESQEGKKKAETNTKGEFTLKAAISKFFGLETKDWKSNNDSLDPTALVDATTDKEYKGKGETTRSGSLKGNISAVILEVLPNSLIRIEGSKIISVNTEEEIMVVSGLVRPRDIDALNRVESSRIANMRIDFYGRGVVGEQQGPGWGARLFQWVWPF